MTSFPTSDSLKIAMLGTRGIPATYSGFETFVEQLSTRLVDRGHDVTVFNRYPFVPSRARVYRGVRIVSLRTLQRKSLDTPVHTLLSTLYLPFIQPDVAYFCGVGNAVFCLVPRLLGIPCIINVDAEDWARGKWSGFARWWLRKSEGWAARLADVVIADSNVISTRYKARFGREAVYIPYGSNISLEPRGTATLDKWGLQPRRYILFCGRMVPENRADLLIRVFKDIVAPDIKLAIVGDAPYSEDLQRELRALADDRVVFTGYAFGDAYAELSRNCIFFVLTSGVEGTRPVLLDQMGFGNCVLVRGSAANTEVVGDAGLTFDDGSEFESLKERIEYLLGHREAVGDYRRRAVERVSARYDWERVTDQYVELFRSLVRDQ
ncbi:MAG: glycosyltransferase [Vicinamibacterales bacterium]